MRLSRENSLVQQLRRTDHFQNMKPNETIVFLVSALSSLSFKWGLYINIV